MAKFLSYAGLSEYTSQIKAYVEGKITSIDKSIFKVVTELPTEDIDENKIYIVPAENTAEGNVYAEYIYANGDWEKLGEVAAEVDLSGYYTKEETDAAITSAIEDAVTNGIDLTPYAKKTDVDEALAAKADASDVYTKTEADAIHDEIDTALAAKANSSDVYTKTEVDSSLSAKADASALADYAKTSDLADYVKTEDLPEVEEITTEEIDALFA